MRSHGAITGQDFIPCLISTRNSFGARSTMIKEKMKEYWKEQKRLWTDPNEWKKLYSWAHWKIELKKELIKQKEEAKENMLKLILIGIPLGIWVVYILYEAMGS